MPELPLASHVDRAQQALADLQGQLALLSPDCQASLCSELDRFTETLMHFMDSTGSAGSRPIEPIMADQNRQAPEPKMSFVMRRARAGMFVRDLVHKTVTWSPELYELLGIDPSEPSRSERFMRMIHPEDYPRVAKATDAAILQGGTYYQEFRVMLPDGREIWLSSIGYVEQDPDGRPLTLTGINQDITEQKKAQLALAAAHAEAVSERNRLLAVLEAIPIGIVIYDLEGRIVQANRGFEELWGYPRLAAYANSDDPAYTAWWVESGQPIRKEEWASAQTVRSGRAVTNQYLEIERSDGTRRFVLNSAAPIRDAADQTVGCVVAIRDISELTEVEKALHQSERSLRESEARLRVALSSLPISVFMLDRDLRYTWIYNPQYGFSADKMLGKRDEEVNPRTGEEHIASLRSVLETGQGMQREARSDLFDPPRYFLLSYEPFYDIDGTITGILGASLDVTDRRRLEEERREAIQQVEMQRQIVENREKERQEIAREIHDGPIQTLVSIMFDLQIIKDSAGLPAGLPAGSLEGEPAVQEELDQVSTRLKGAVRELRDVVNNLRPPALLRFGLGKSLKIYAEDFRSKHPEIDLDVLFDLPDDRIYFSEETTLSLYRLCQEGLNNIARHAQATKASIRFAEEGERIVLEIQDNGVGFSVPKDLIRKTKEGHYGLAGMKERVQAMGGEFKIKSFPGAGSTIEVMVPLEQASN